MGYLLAIFRLLAFLTITFLTAVFIFFGRILGLKISFSVFRLAIKSVRFFLNIKVKYSGNLPDSPGLIMSNHRSYIDIVLIPSKVPYAIVAKKQVRSWPVVGIAAIALKVIFVDRDSIESRKLVRADIINRISQGLSVLVYPEGTTYAGPGILPLKPGMFNTAAAEGFLIYPVAIEFEDKSMAWTGDDTFIRHFFQSFRKFRIPVSVSFGPKFSGSKADVLREQCTKWIDAETRRLA